MSFGPRSCSSQPPQTGLLPELPQLGVVSAANSLVGSTASDQVGSNFVTGLSNGNYVVARLLVGYMGGVFQAFSVPFMIIALITMIFVKAVESLRSFDLIYTMTNGGPGIATETLDLYAYQTGIGMSGRISYAAAMSVLLLVLSTLAFSFLWKRSQRWSD